MCHPSQTDHNGSVSTAAILIVVLVGLVLGDVALVRAYTHRRRKRDDPPSGHDGPA
jgi:hypothetical protein